MAPHILKKVVIMLALAIPIKTLIGMEPPTKKQKGNPIPTIWNIRARLLNGSLEEIMAISITKNEADTIKNDETFWFALATQEKLKIIANYFGTQLNDNLGTINRTKFIIYHLGGINLKLTVHSYENLEMLLQNCNIEDIRTVDPIDPIAYNLNPEHYEQNNPHEFDPLNRYPEKFTAERDWCNQWHLRKIRDKHDSVQQFLRKREIGEALVCYDNKEIPNNT